jgi:hypothetical protein
MHPTMTMPVRLYAERDPETNEKHWYETPGMGDEYVRADEVERLRELVRCLVENDPNDYAADAVTVLDVWRKDARKALGLN